MDKEIIIFLKFKNDEKKKMLIDGNECIVNKCFQTMNGILLQSNHLYKSFGIKGKPIFNDCIIKRITESKCVDEFGNNIKNLALLISFKSISR